MKKLIIISTLATILVFTSCSMNRRVARTNNTVVTDTTQTVEVPDVIENVSETNAMKIEKVITQAETYMGIPYCFGGVGLKCFDCSGFVMVSFRVIDMELPRMCGPIAEMGTLISKMEDLKRGDLVFFTKTFETTETVTHIGICTAPMTMIHASSSKGISYTNLSYDYWQKHFYCGKRIF